MSKSSLYITAFVAVFIAGLCVGGRFFPFQGTFTERVDTCVIERTIVDSAAVLAHYENIGFELVPVCSLDSLKEAANHPRIVTKEVEKPVIVTRDSIVFIQVPIEERQFTGTKDSVSYNITTTGYNTNIKAVSFTYPEKIVTKVKMYDNTRKVGFDIVTGPGLVFTPSGNLTGGWCISAGIGWRF